MAMKQTIIEMIERVPGGKSAVAGFLGFSEAELNNRLYQTKGQRFKNEELIAIQLEYGCTQFIEELCRTAGGRFVPDTCADDLDAVEMANIQLHELSARGLLFAVLEQALEDGEITSQGASVKPNHCPERELLPPLQPSTKVTAPSKV